MKETRADPFAVVGIVRSLSEALGTFNLLSEELILSGCSITEFASNATTLMGDLGTCPSTDMALTGVTADERF